MIVEEKKSVKAELSDVLLAVKWAHISTHYFGKSRSWFSQRLNGYDGNYEKNDFSDQERQQLKDALLDLSKRLEECARSL